MTINNQINIRLKLMFHLATIILSILFNLSKILAANEDAAIGFIQTQLELNSGWSQLPFNITESPWIPNIFKIYSPIPFILLYSDAFCPGKMVSIYVNGTFKMNSTTVPQQIGTCNPRIEEPFGTFALPDIFSHANIVLPEGEHEISVKVIQSDPEFPTGIMFLRALIPPKYSCNKR